MADRKATNKYYPPEWEPKHGSINKFRGSHPLRSRASKISQGIMVVRTELPWGTFCLGCNAHLQKGKRFNAEKSKVCVRFYRSDKVAGWNVFLYANMEFQDEVPPL